MKEERTLVRGMGVDLLMMGLTALLVLLAVGTTWFLTVVGAFTERYPSWSGLLQPGLVALSKVMSVGATGLLFYVLYRFPPVATLSARALVIASVTGTVLFQCAKFGFAWYVAASQENIDLYGAIGGLMFLFAWLYYAAVVLPRLSGFAVSHSQTMVIVQPSFRRAAWLLASLLTLSVNF